MRVFSVFHNRELPEQGDMALSSSSGFRWGRVVRGTIPGGCRRLDEVDQLGELFARWGLSPQLCRDIAAFLREDGKVRTKAAGWGEIRISLIE